MRDLSFFLRLHAFLPLARFSTTHRKPYLPLEVRYLIRPTGEVFLYLSNNPDNKTWSDDFSLFGTAERIARFIPATGNIPLLLEFLPMSPEGGFSYLTNQYAFLGMLCRRGLACHYLASRDRNLSSFTFRGEEKREEESFPAQMQFDMKLGPIKIEQPYTTQRSILELAVLCLQFVPILIITNNRITDPYIQPYVFTLMKCHAGLKSILYILSLFHIYKIVTTKKLILLDILNIFLICNYLYILNKWM